jgi:hypothetical protein
VEAHSCQAKYSFSSRSLEMTTSQPLKILAEKNWKPYVASKGAKEM